MGEQAKKLTLAIVEDLKGKGYTQSEIAEAWGVTRQYVSWIVHTYGGRQTPRQATMREFPFKVPVEMGQCSPYRNLRNHGEYVATGGIGMSFDKVNRLRGFYKRLENEVLEFDPNLPPIEGVSPAGGWAYRPRTPEDGNLLIRVNEYTDLSDVGRMIWRLPSTYP